MNIYSKNGDKGTTNLVHTKNVSKSDDRVRLFGDLDELNCYLGLVKTMIDETDTIRMLEKKKSPVLRNFFPTVWRCVFRGSAVCRRR